MKRLLRDVGVAGVVASLAALGAPGQASGQDDPPPPVPEIVQLEATVSPEEVELGTDDEITVASVDPCPEVEPAFTVLYFEVTSWDGSQIGPVLDSGDVPLNEDGSWSVTRPAPAEEGQYYFTAICTFPLGEIPPEDVDLYYYDVPFGVVDPGDPAPTTTVPPKPPKPPEPPTGPRPAPPVAGDPGFTG